MRVLVSIALMSLLGCANPTYWARPNSTDDQMQADETYCSMKAQKHLTAGSGAAAHSPIYALIGLWAYDNAVENCMESRGWAEVPGAAPRPSHVSSGPQRAPTSPVTEWQELLPGSEEYIPPVEWCHKSCDEDHSGRCGLCDENYTGWRELPIQPEFEIVPLQWQEKK